VQGATDALPANNTAAAQITIAPGLYHEFIHMTGKSNVTLHGQDRKQTIILGTNNNTLNPSTVGRSLVGFDKTNGLIVENLTIHNLTPQGGSQAEALRLQNCDKCVIRDADILSLQDTLLWGGRVYASNCYIAGNVDYVWGSGVAYFNKCEIHTVGRSGVIVQARNAVGAYGYVFVDSKLTADSAATNNMLARIDVGVYSGSHVAYINCQMTNIAAAGWTVTNGSPSATLRFWEYQSTDASGNALNVSGRLAGLTKITADQATMMRTPTVVLNGWQPPN
jgi:pectin methylesterase-like acyl-CoA thioesterase